MLAPHLVAGGAGEDDGARPLGRDRPEVLPPEILEHAHQARTEQREPAAPLLLAQNREIDAGRVEDLGQRDRDLLGQREIGRDAPGDVGHLGRLADVAVLGRAAHVLDPLGALGVVLAEDVAALGQVPADEIDLLRVGGPVHQVLPRRVPQLLQADPDRADLPAAAAESAAEDGLGETLELLRVGRLRPEEPPQAAARLEPALEALHAVDRRELAVRGSAGRRAHVGAQPAPGAGVHFEPLARREAGFRHIRYLCGYQATRGCSTAASGQAVVKPLLK